MALYSDAAMVLYYDIVGDNAEHDAWHTYEHMRERLSIPGFLRATRWVAQAATPKYLVIYELAGIDIGTSAAYLERLNHPTPWTSATMRSFRHMVRGFCDIVAGSGFGFGHAAISVRFTPRDGEEASLRDMPLLQIDVRGTVPFVHPVRSVLLVAQGAGLPSDRGRHDRLEKLPHDQWAVR